MARLALGDPAPPFDLPDVDGSSHSAEDYAAKPLAVVFSCVTGFVVLLVGFGKRGPLLVLELVPQGSDAEGNRRIGRDRFGGWCR